MQLPAKQLAGVSWPSGSNPDLSAIVDAQANPGKRNEPGFAMSKKVVC